MSEKKLTLPRCKICEKEFIPKKNNQVTCLSRDCIKKNKILLNKKHALKKYIGKKRTTEICVICGRTLSVARYNQVVCSEKCRLEWKSRRCRLTFRKKKEREHGVNAICSECSAEYYWQKNMPDICTTCSSRRYKQAIKNGVVMTKDAPGQPIMIDFEIKQQIKTRYVMGFDFLDVTFEGRSMMDANICPFG